MSSVGSCITLPDHCCLGGGGGGGGGGGVVVVVCVERCRESST